jgi:Leu/Phe-tRNA-protein transferase
MNENQKTDPWKSGANTQPSYTSRRVTSELAPSESAGPAKVVAAVATGSLPVSSAEALCAEWEWNASREILPDDERHVYRICAKELRREIASATERQLEENTDSAA